MRQSLLITPEPIDEAALRGERPIQAATGAVVVFLGVVRDSEAGTPISALEYEAFDRMAEHQFRLIFARIEQQWPVDNIRVVHRVGVVKVGEASLWVEVTASHRREAFEACAYLIDEMKQFVPIWKHSVKGS
jgi:molybdopterin synthase catalytic subunit